MHSRGRRAWPLSEDQMESALRPFVDVAVARRDRVRPVWPSMARSPTGGSALVPERGLACVGCRADSGFDADAEINRRAGMRFGGPAEILQAANRLWKSQRQRLRPALPAAIAYGSPAVGGRGR